MKIEPTFAENLCQNNVKKLSRCIIYYREKKSLKLFFVHPPLRKKIILCCRRMRLDTLSAVSFGASWVKNSHISVHNNMKKFRFFLSRLYGTNSDKKPSHNTVPLNQPLFEIRSRSFKETKNRSRNPLSQSVYPGGPVRQPYSSSVASPHRVGRVLSVSPVVGIGTPPPL
jgi:hypothetical protein